MTKYRPDRLRNIGRRQHGQRHLIQQRLKSVVIAPIHNRYVHRETPNGLCRVQSPEPATHDHHTRTARLSKGKKPCVVSQEDLALVFLMPQTLWR